MGRNPKKRVDGFTPEERKKIMDKIHEESFSVIDFCRENNFSRQWLYYVLSAKSLTLEVKEKFINLFNI